MPTICNLEVNKAILEQVKVAEKYDCMLEFLKKQKLCKQN